MTLLWPLLLACRLSAQPPACGASMPSSSRTLAPGSVPGAELLVIAGDPEPTGAVCRLSDGTLHTGPEGFRAVAPLAKDDPAALARMAMLLAEGPGIAGTQLVDPPPTLSGRTLTYWRTDKTLDNHVRVTVDLDTLSVDTALDTAIARDAAAPADPIARAERELASDSLDDRMAGLRRLDALQTAEGDAALIVALLNNERWQVRKEAARRLGQRPTPPEGSIAALSRSVALDGYAQVRAAAAVALGALGDPEGRPALKKAADGDADASVRSMASASLRKLR